MLNNPFLTILIILPIMIFQIWLIREGNKGWRVSPYLITACFVLLLTNIGPLLNVIGFFSEDRTLDIAKTGDTLLSVSFSGSFLYFLTAYLCKDIHIKIGNDILSDVSRNKLNYCTAILATLFIALFIFDSNFPLRSIFENGISDLRTLRANIELEPPKFLGFYESIFIYFLPMTFWLSTSLNKINVPVSLFLFLLGLISSACLLQKLPVVIFVIFSILVILKSNLNRIQKLLAYKSKLFLTGLLAVIISLSLIQEKDSKFYSITKRTLTGQSLASLTHLTLTPSEFDHMHGAGISNLRNILPFTFIPYSKLIWKMANAEKFKNRAKTGSMPVAFTTQWYLNYSWPGLIILTVLCSIIVSLISNTVMLLSSPALQTALCFGISLVMMRISYTSFTVFLYNWELFLATGVFLTIFSKKNIAT